MSFEEINAKLDTALTGIKAAQDVASRNEKRIDSLDKDQIKKINEDVTANMQELQDLKQKQAVVEKTNENLEKLILKLPAGKSTDDNSSVIKSKNEFISYMRKGVAMDNEVVKEICTKMAGSLVGVSDAEREYHVKTLQEGVNPDGGYWVRPEISDKIVTRVFETSPLRNLADVVTTSSESLQLIIDDDEAAAEWVGEVTARAETATPQIGLMEIHCHELSAKPKATQRMLDDAGFDIEAWLNGKVSSQFSRKENTSFVVGDGALKPKGFLSYDAWAAAGVYERNKIEQINSGAAATYTADGVKKLKNSLIEDYQAGAVFGIKRDSFEDIITLKDGTGRYLLNVNSLKQGDDQILLGKPVVFMHDIPAIAANALAMVYGNFKVGYTIVDRVGIRVLRDPYTSKPYVKFYTTKRVGGAVTNFESLKIQKLAV